MSFRSYFPALSHSEVCLDNAATTQLAKVAIETAQTHLGELQSNVSRGLYASSEKTTQVYFASQEKIARALNLTDQQRLVYGSNATDLLNKVAHAICQSLAKGSEIITTAAEHHSNFLPWQQLAARYGLTVKLVPLEANGRIQWQSLPEFVNQKTRVLVTHHVSNVTGFVNDLARLSRYCQEQQILTIIDGTQMLHHQLPDLQKLAVDAYIFSSHKAYSLGGLGVLCIDKALMDSLPHTSWGGGMVKQVSEDSQHNQFIDSLKWQAGTPNVLLARCLAETLEWLKTQPVYRHPATPTLHKSLIQLLSEFKNITILNDTQELVDTESSIPIVSFVHHKLHAHDVADLLANENIAVRAGHHCAQLLIKHWRVDACVRISLAHYTNQDDLERLKQALVVVDDLATKLSA